MSLTDPVADMLTRIRNACSAGHRRVDMPVSKLKTEVARLVVRDTPERLELVRLAQVDLVNAGMVTGEVLLEEGEPCIEVALAVE